MILFGHLGLTYAATRVLDKHSNNLKPENLKIDYRLIFIGSVLPDLIDKSIIFFTSNETFKSGRLIGHTFLFALILFIMGYILLKKKSSSWMLILAFASFVHQILDSMWNYLDIFFWPFFGYSISKGNLNFNNWIKYALSVFNKENPAISFLEIKDRLLSNPELAVAEILGIIIILYFMRNLIKFKQTKNFIKSGKVTFKKTLM